MSAAATNVCLALCFGTLLAFVGPALDDLDAAQAVAADLQAVPESTQRRARMEAAAQAMCGGENAVATWLSDGSVQCRTKRGHKTQRVNVAEVR